MRDAASLGWPTGNADQERSMLFEEELQNEGFEIYRQLCPAPAFGGSGERKHGPAEAQDATFPDQTTSILMALACALLAPAPAHERLKHAARSLPAEPKDNSQQRQPPCGPFQSQKRVLGAAPPPHQARRMRRAPTQAAQQQI